MYVGHKVDGHNYSEAAADFYQRLARTPDRLLPGERAAGPKAFIERLTLERVLREEQHEEHRSFSRTLRWFDAQHKEVLARIEAERTAGVLASDPLVRLLARRRRLLLVTVNFDQIIEAKAAGDVKPFVTADDFAGLSDYLDEYTKSGGAVPLIKAHGDIEVPDTIVADITTTSSGLARPVLEALTHVRERLLAQAVSPLWHIGYSMRDVDLEDFWSDTGFAERATERWVSPMPDPAVERFIEQKRVPRWALAADPQQAEESIVTLTATDFFALLDDDAARRWQ
nr:SIR2 family protein [Blastococcus saxobsidens]